MCLAVYLPDENMTEVVYLGAWPEAQPIEGESTALRHSCLASITGAAP